MIERNVISRLKRRSVPRRSLFVLVVMTLFVLVIAARVQKYRRGADTLTSEVCRIVGQSFAENSSLSAVVFEQFPEDASFVTDKTWIERCISARTESSANAASLAMRKVEAAGRFAEPVIGVGDAPSGFVVADNRPVSRRMRRRFAPEQVLFIRQAGPTADEPIRIASYQKLPFQEQLLTEPIVLNGKDHVRDINIPLAHQRLSDCYLDVLATTSSKVRLAALHLFRQDGSSVEGGSTYSAADSSDAEDIFMRVLVRGDSPLFLRLASQPIPFDSISQVGDGTEIVFNRIEIRGCGSEVKSKVFLGSHNPDPNHAFHRWTSPQGNYSVVLQYLGSPFSGNTWTVGVNGGMNMGDYYCYPDDVISLWDKDNKKMATYAGVMRWDRVTQMEAGRLTIALHRTPKSGFLPYEKFDGTPRAHFDSYPKDNLPLDIRIKHVFDVDRTYGEVAVRIKSLAPHPVRIRWTFQDSSVFDFKNGTDAGVRIMSLNEELRDSLYISTRATAGDNPIAYREIYPARANLAVMEHSNSPFLRGYFAGGYYGIHQADSPVILDEVRPDSLQIRGAFNAQIAPPNRVHGIWFELALEPGEEKQFTYYKFFLSHWLSEESLRSSVKKSLAEIGMREAIHEDIPSR